MCGAAKCESVIYGHCDNSTTFALILPPLVGRVEPWCSSPSNETRSACHTRDRDSNGAHIINSKMLDATKDTIRDSNLKNNDMQTSILKCQQLAAQLCPLGYLHHNCCTSQTSPVVKII